MPSLIEDFDLQPKYSLSQSYSGSPRTPDPFHVDASMGSVKSNGPAHKTYRAPANKGVDTLESLRALPTLREIPWKEGRELAPEQISKQCTRVQTRGAFLLVQRGQVRIPSCNRCTAGTGRFSQCVSLDGWFKGACATCEMATRGNLCSLRKELEVNGTVKAATSIMPQSSDSGRTEGVSRKRKHVSDTSAARSTSEAHISHYQPKVSWAQEGIQTCAPITANGRGSSHQDSLVGERPPSLDYNYQHESSPLHRAQRESLEPAHHPNQVNSGYAMNEHSGLGMSADASEESGNNGPFSLTPDLQLQPSPQSSCHRYKGASTAPGLQMANPPDTPLIDTLPRKKQKQILSILGGIQSGIRSVRQQTEDLQKQLDILHEALGIGIDGEDDT